MSAITDRSIRTGSGEYGALETALLDGMHPRRCVGMVHEKPSFGRGLKRQRPSTFFPAGPKRVPFLGAETIEQIEHIQEPGL